MAIPQRDPIERSIKAYARKHGRYERVHSEIFNDREQARCRRVVELALSSVTSGRDVPRALDLGCGTGNLTRHFLELGAEVLAADVSPHFLRMVEQRFGGEPALQTIRINGRDLEKIDDASVDVAAAYSVLHHVPDYLAMVREMLRVLRPGGVLYVDHEANENFWHATDSLGDFREEVAEAKRRGLPGWDPEARRWQRFLLPSKWTAAFHRDVAPRLPASWRRGPLLDPRHQATV